MDAADINADRRRRLVEARLRAGFKSARAAAVSHRWPESTYRAHETGGRNFGLEDAMRYGEAFNVSHEWIWSGLETARRTLQNVNLPNALVRREIVTTSARKLNVLGSAAGGVRGEFAMNGQVVDTVPCPPELENVLGAYAVYVVGDSMEPRYFAGELVYVHPNKPYRKNDFVVVQIVADDGDATPAGFIKQFCSFSPTTLTLHQYNPDQEIEFPRKSVVSIHRIVGSGEA